MVEMGNVIALIYVGTLDAIKHFFIKIGVVTF